eukprot:4775833-Ditylum_brightwellii.AAC.1
MRGDIIKCYLCGGNHYANICEQKKERESNNKKRGGHMHLTTNEYDEGKVDDYYGDWGSVSIGGFILHQHGTPVLKMYKQSLPETKAEEPSKTLIPSAPPDK